MPHSCGHSDIALTSSVYPKVLNSFDTLKDAWVSRKTELEGRVKAMGGAGLFGGGNMYGGRGEYGGQGQELARLEHVSPPVTCCLNSKFSCLTAQCLQLIKEADNNFGMS